VLFASAIRIIKSRRMGEAMHVVHMGEVLVRKPEGKESNWKT
jgi:hypothetical protein